MTGKTDCFLACGDFAALKPMTEALLGSGVVRHIYVVTRRADKDGPILPEGCTLMEAYGMADTETIKRMAAAATAEYTLLLTKPVAVTLGMKAVERMLRVAADSGAALTYSDHWKAMDGERVAHPVTDYQEGSVRDDFDFGSLLLVNTALLKKYAACTTAGYRYAGLYDLRLFLSREGTVLHINEYLYTEDETDMRASGVKQFDYVNPANREVQIEMEHAVTAHLDAIGARIDSGAYPCPDFAEQDFPVEASVIIPVRNRVGTIADAVRSALSQKTDFDYNVIVVDNHSTDGTTELLANHQSEYAAERLVVLRPERTDLGIGGCWNMAINDSRCGRFAVQLDSDDLYSSENTLQTIVDAFREQKAAMIVGSYRMCDFELNTLPPGLIDHREWTETNGPNNALRINGLGAPRAFFTPLLRQVQFPNTSYGEDYALGLIFSRHYRIGRIYSELYLCRRWSGNSDAALGIEKVNANNTYKDRLRTIEIAARRRMNGEREHAAGDDAARRFFARQMETWTEARRRYRELREAQTRELPCGAFTLVAQYNPARMISTGASIDKNAIAARPCFLCESNRPGQQIKRTIDDDFELLVNPFPILPMHFTIPARTHRPQLIGRCYGEIYAILDKYPDLMVFYNGPKCGASAPDHAHFQAGTSGVLPLQRDWQRLCRNLAPVIAEDDTTGIWEVTDYPCPAFLVRSGTAEAGTRLFYKLYSALPMGEDDTEPMMNIVSWRSENEYITVVFPRRKHRPECYSAEGDKRFTVSPGALDMAGLMITPCAGDFDRLTPDVATGILREVAMADEDARGVAERMKKTESALQADGSTQAMSLDVPDVNVGIVSGRKICFSLNSPYMAKGETIEGEQTVDYFEGTILWNGNQYHELTFTPQADGASFSLHDVTIGVNFHWERKETQVFCGTLRLVVDADKITAINILPVEDYLVSVISSEMKATSSPELLKAHAVISRSWLLAQIDKRNRLQDGQNGFFSFTKNEDELIRWYDREDHTIFDVCADDHCQRYQGITRANNRAVEEAVAATRGQILTYGDEICDARFSKCCGGITEEFRYCWEDTPKPYLVSVRDYVHTLPGRCLSGIEERGERCENGEIEENGCNGISHYTLNAKHYTESEPDINDGASPDQWLRTSPDAFCNTADKSILSQVLNDYDCEMPDFYRWRVEYTQEELSGLINGKLKDDFGAIIDLVPVERGKSGRISKLKIVGTKKTFTIGKELEIRRALSETHLYSSAFVVDKDDVVNGIPGRFTLIGAGWGHGVGLCQIGAAVMGARGYGYDSILLHYYRGAEIKEIY